MMLVNVLKELGNLDDEMMDNPAEEDQYPQHT